MIPFLISLLDNQLIAYAVTNTSPTKAPRPISWEDYRHQAETPWSMYYGTPLSLNMHT